MANEPEVLQPSTLDELMSKDPLELTNADLDKIIAYQRSMRAKAEGGVKVAKVKAASGVSLIDQLGITAKPEAFSGRRKL